MKKTAEKLCCSTYSLVTESRFVAQTGVMTITGLWIMRYTIKYTGQMTLLKGAIYTFFPPFTLSVMQKSRLKFYPLSSRRGEIRIPVLWREKIEGAWRHHAGPKVPMSSILLDKRIDVCV